MHNEENLKPVRSKEEARERGRAGGIASGTARREKANLRKCLEILLEKEMKDRNGKEISGAEALSAKLFQSAMKGDVRAFEVLRDTAGQKPVEKVESKNTDIVIDFGSIPEDVNNEN